MEGQHMTKVEIQQIIEGLGYEFVGMEIKKELGSLFFRVFIDSIGGIQVKDCEISARAINRFMEEREVDLSEEKYYLEISSPGLERPLFSIDDYKRFEGKNIVIKFKTQFESHRRVKGLIGKTNDLDSVEIACEFGSLLVPLEEVKSARLTYDFKSNEVPVDKNNKRVKKKKRKKVQDTKKQEGEGS